MYLWFCFSSLTTLIFTIRTRDHVQKTTTTLICVLLIFRNKATRKVALVSEINFALFFLSTNNLVKSIYEDTLQTVNPAASGFTDGKSFNQFVSQLSQQNQSYSIQSFQSNKVLILLLILQNFRQFLFNSFWRYTTKFKIEKCEHAT